MIKWRFKIKKDFKRGENIIIASHVRSISRIKIVFVQTPLITSSECKRERRKGFWTKCWRCERYKNTFLEWLQSCFSVFYLSNLCAQQSPVSFSHQFPWLWNYIAFENVDKLNIEDTSPATSSYARNVNVLTLNI